MTDQTKITAMQKVKYYTGGAVGAGIVLVLLPSLALFFGVQRIGEIPTFGLPVLAVFGIMILLGSLALVATLFSRLELSDKSQALALPEGSIRAAIALSLIVLFAIISIMLYQSLSAPYVIQDVADADRAAMVNALASSVIAVVPERCDAMRDGKPVPLAECPPANRTYDIHVRQSATRESSDLAKQLLILIGTLMTSVTSFYFASRATESVVQDEGDGANQGGAGAGGATAGGAAVATKAGDEDDRIDGCDVAITDATPDEALPAARGGVA